MAGWKVKEMDKESKTAESDSDRLLTVQDVASRLSVSVRTVYRMVASDMLPKPLMIGGLRRFSAKEINEHMERWKRDQPRST